MKRTNRGKPILGDQIANSILLLFGIFAILFMFLPRVSSLEDIPDASGIIIEDMYLCSENREAQFNNNIVGIEEVNNLWVCGENKTNYDDVLRLAIYWRYYPNNSDPEYVAKEIVWLGEGSFESYIHAENSEPISKLGRYDVIVKYMHNAVARIEFTVVEK